MTSASVLQSDQRRALWLSTAAFTVCFAVWTIFAIIGIQIQRNLGLTDTQLGLLVGTPILTGSLIRLILGIWSDQYGGRLVFFVTMLSAAAMTALLSLAYDYPTFLLAALGVGISGGSFSVGIAYVAKWFPREKQGTALGIFGAGNVGAAVTKLAAPTVMIAYGWQAVALLWAAALTLIAVVFFVMTKDDPVHAARRISGEKPESLRAMLEPLKNVQVWRFSLYYFFVFGGFVSLALWLPHYLIGVYGVGSRGGGRDRRGLFHSGLGLPRLWRTSVGSVRRAPRDVLDVPGLGRLHVHPVVSADALRGARQSWHDRVLDVAGCRRLHRRRGRARLLHEFGESRGLSSISRSTTPVVWAPSAAWLALSAVWAVSSSPSRSAR